MRLYTVRERFTFCFAMFLLFVLYKCFLLKKLKSLYLIMLNSNKKKLGKSRGMHYSYTNISFKNMRFAIYLKFK